MILEIKRRSISSHIILLLGQCNLKSGNFFPAKGAKCINDLNLKAHFFLLMFISLNLKHQTKAETMGDQEEMGIEFQVDKAWGFDVEAFLGHLFS